MFFDPIEQRRNAFRHCRIVNNDRYICDYSFESHFHPLLLSAKYTMLLKQILNILKLRGEVGVLKTLISSRAAKHP